jgi:hypothetical protein
VLLGEQLRRLRERLQAAEAENEQLRAGGAPRAAESAVDDGAALRAELVEVETENARLREEMADLRRQLAERGEEESEVDVVAVLARELASGRGDRIAALEQEAMEWRKQAEEEKAGRKRAEEKAEVNAAAQKTAALRATLALLLEGRSSSALSFGVMLSGVTPETMARWRFDPAQVLHGVAGADKVLRGLAKGATLLHAAAASGNKAGVKALLVAGAKVDAVDINDQTPRDAALACGHEPVALYFDEIARRQRASIYTKSVPITPMPARTPLPAHATPHAEASMRPGDDGL